MSAKEQTWKQWLRGVLREKKAYPEDNHPSKLFNGCTAALTGTDYRVLDAFVPALKLYVYTDDPALLHVARLLLKQMQPSTRWIARELIPFVRNWEDRERLWPLIVDDERLAAVGRSYAHELQEEELPS